MWVAGTVGANKVMASELLRLVKRSPFQVRVPKPVRQDSIALRYPFDPAIAWVAAYYRSASRIGRGLASSPAVRLEPLVADLVPILAVDDRLPRGRSVTFTVEVRKGVQDFEAGPLQVRGAVESAFEQALAGDGAARRWSKQGCRVGPGGASCRRRMTIAAPWSSSTWAGTPAPAGSASPAGAGAATRNPGCASHPAFAKWMPHAEPLVDPTAGSGTIAVEAALLARGFRRAQADESTGVAIAGVCGSPGRGAAAVSGHPSAYPRL